MLRSWGRTARPRDGGPACSRRGLSVAAPTFKGEGRVGPSFFLAHPRSPNRGVARSSGADWQRQLMLTAHGKCAGDWSDLKPWGGCDQFRCFFSSSVFFAHPTGVGTRLCTRLRVCGKEGTAVGRSSGRPWSGWPSRHRRFHHTGSPRPRCGGWESVAAAGSAKQSGVEAERVGQRGQETSRGGGVECARPRRRCCATARPAVGTPRQARLPRASFAPRGIAPLWQDGGKKNKKKKCASATLSGTSLAGARTAGRAVETRVGGRLCPNQRVSIKKKERTRQRKKLDKDKHHRPPTCRPRPLPTKSASVAVSTLVRPRRRVPHTRRTPAGTVAGHGEAQRCRPRAPTAPQPPRHRHGRGRVPAPPALARRRRRAAAVPGTTTTADKETQPQAMPGKGDCAPVPSP